MSKAKQYYFVFLIYLSLEFNGKCCSNRHFNAINVFKGNEYIHAISTNGQHTVRFILGKKGTEKYAEYSHFRVESEQKKYMLNVSDYSGTAGMLSFV